MTDVMQLTALRLRSRASRCRQLAQTAYSDGIAEELCALAEDYEHDASRLEARLVTAREAVQFGFGLN